MIFSNWKRNYRKIFMGKLSNLKKNTNQDVDMRWYTFAGENRQKIQQTWPPFRDKIQ
jgi:hypothetical protein